MNDPVGAGVVVNITDGWAVVIFTASSMIGGIVFFLGRYYGGKSASEKIAKLRDELAEWHDRFPVRNFVFLRQDLKIAKTPHPVCPGCWPVIRPLQEDEGHRYPTLADARAIQAHGAPPERVLGHMSCPSCKTKYSFSGLTIKDLQREALEQFAGQNKP